MSLSKFSISSLSACEQLGAPPEKKKKKKKKKKLKLLKKENCYEFLKNRTFSENGL